MDTRVCTRCNTEKPVSEFYRRGPARAVQCWCKVCKLEYRKEHNRVTRLIPVLLTTKQIQKIAVKAVHNTGIRASEFKCAACNEVANEFHHWSYAECDRLLVVPLCYSCHKYHHRGTLGVAIGKEQSVDLGTGATDVTRSVW